MNISVNYSPTKEDIENLPQLDRIEYKLDRERIGRSFFDLTRTYGFKFLFPLTILCYLIVMFGTGHENYGTVLTYLIVPLVKFLVYGCWIVIALDIWVMYLEKGLRNKLNEKYFGKEVKKWMKKKQK